MGEEHRFFYGGSQNSIPVAKFWGDVWHGIYYILNELCAKYDTCTQFENTLSVFEG